MLFYDQDMEWFTRFGTKHDGAVESVDEVGGTAAYWNRELCHRCGGAGGFRHWPGFTCFDCGGNRYEQPKLEKLYTAEKLAALNAAQAKRDAKRAAKAQAKAQKAAEALTIARDAFETANPGVIAEIARLAEANPFMASMNNRLATTGNLTEGQLNAVKTSLQRNAAREAARAASQHVGVVGERMELTVTVDVVIHLEAGGYGWAAPSIYLGRDSQGNRIVYKGTGNFAGKGETVRVIATVKEHGERQGELQTIIARPKTLGLVEAA
jgi:hypothetical protein